MGRLLTPEELPKFKKLTDGYSPNETVLDEFRSSSFAIIAGPSGAGKDTLRNKLIEKRPDAYQVVRSTTTRPPRVGEMDGVDYHFRSVEEVEQGLVSREFFQAALVHDQQISCLHVDEITKLNKGQTGLSILIVETEQQLHALKGDIKTIFIVPPSIDVLRQRLSNERPLGNEEIERRMKAGEQELGTALDRTDYYCLISDDLETLANQAHDFFQHEQRDEQADRLARTVVRDILNTLSI